MIIHVDLSAETAKRFSESTEFKRQWLGGRGYNSRLLYCYRNKIPENWRSRQNVIAISAGRLAGTKFPSSGRTTISVLKSPVNNSFGDGNFGGHFAPALKLAGIDSLVITGKSNEPCYLYVDQNGKVSKKSFEGRRPMKWGCIATESYLQMKHRGSAPKILVLTIGPGGGNQVVTAVVNCENRVAGGGGSGAIMGSKNLKAIVVEYDPDQFIKPKYESQFDEVCEQCVAHIENHPVFNTFKTYGTTSLVEIHSGLKYFPSLNWLRGTWKHWKKISGQTYLERELQIDPNHLKHQDELAATNKLGCRNCPIVCSNQEKVEYETLNCLGSKIGIHDLDTIVFYNTVYMNDGGLDVIETTSIISTLMELSEKKVIDLDFPFGDEEKVLKFLQEFLGKKPKTLGGVFSMGFVTGLYRAESQGIFNIDWWSHPELKDCTRYRDIYDKFYVHSKGKALSGVVPNEKNKGVALAIATSTRGADHLRSLPTLATYASWYLGKGGWKKLIKMLTIPLKSANLMKSDAKFLVNNLWDTYQYQFGVPVRYINEWRMKGFLLNDSITDGWGGMIKFTQALYAVSDSLSTCRFTSPWRFGIGPLKWELALLYLGLDKVNERTIMESGHFINMLERELLFYYSKPPVDSVPQRFFKGKKALTKETWDAIYTDYRNECGLDKNGRPHPSYIDMISTGDYSDRDMIKYFEEV